MEYMAIVALAFVQNVAFSLASRARNRDHFGYHAVAATLSNMVWFATFKMLVTEEMDWWLAAPYIVGTVAGSLWGASISMRIEKIVGAKT